MLRVGSEFCPSSQGHDMPMSLIRGQAAANALSNLSANQLFTTIQDNQHIVAKHYNKQNALNEAILVNHAQGYFKRVVTTEIHGLADFKNLSPNKKVAVLNQIGNPKDLRKGVSKGIGNFNKNGQLTSTGTAAVDSSVVMDIVHLLLNSNGIEYRQARGDANALNNRVAVVGPIPAGFVGRAIDPHGTKSYAPNYAVLVISAPIGANPQIVTVFPADQAYAQGTPLLV